MESWAQRRQFLMDMACNDLECNGEVQPCFLAFAGERMLFVAFMRSFAKGAYMDPLVELVALAAPMDADRLALSIAGRAWSLNDPLPPVLPGVGDLRQRVLNIEEADGARGRPRGRSTAIAYDLVDGRVHWGSEVTTEEETGRISAALRIAIANRRKLKSTVEMIAEQARRCVALGHELWLAEAQRADPVRR